MLGVICQLQDQVRERSVQKIPPFRCKGVQTKIETVLPLRRLARGNDCRSRLRPSQAIESPHVQLSIKPELTEGGISVFSEAPSHVGQTARPRSYVTSPTRDSRRGLFPVQDLMPAARTDSLSPASSTLYARSTPLGK